MKTIQSLARYFPEKCGGIQVNLDELIPHFQSMGIEVQVVAAHSSHEQEYSYSHNGVKVYRYPIDPKFQGQPNRPQVIYKGFENFTNWLKKQQADIYHQHHWEATCGLSHLRLAKELGMKTVVTVHYPLPICQRNTLMLNGQVACDGKIDVVRCTQCSNTPQRNSFRSVSHRSDRGSKKLSSTALKALSHIPISLINRLEFPESVYLPSSPGNNELGSLVRPFIIPSYIAIRQKNLQDMAKYADRIIVVCNWLYQSLLINGINKEKLTLSRHGIAYETENFYPKANNQTNQTNQTKNLKVAFLGRWDISKGIDILIRAIKNLPSEIKIELFIHAIAQDKAYYKKVIELIDNDPRIYIEKQLTREELPNVLKNYDLLAVPSQWLETGPLVVLEAHANGLPVIGSNLGGIAELVEDEKNGLLIEYDNVNAWTEGFKRLYWQDNLLRQLQEGIKPIRNVNQQASEIVQVYSQISRAC